MSVSPGDSCELNPIDKVVADGKCLLMLRTPTCPHGAAMKNFVEEHKAEFEGKGIKVVEYVADPASLKCQEMVKAINVQACPTMLFYDNKKEIKRYVPTGQTREEVLKALLDF